MIINFRIASHCLNYACSLECKPRNVHRPRETIEDDDDDDENDYNLNNDSDVEDNEEVAQSGGPSQFYYTSLCEENHDMRYNCMKQLSNHF